jgi:hypothetical protein
MRSFTSAFLALALVTVVLPGILPEMCGRLLAQKELLELPWFFESQNWVPGMSPWCQRVPQLVQLAIALTGWLALRRMLAERTFITKSELIELPAPRTVKWQSA